MLTTGAIADRLGGELSGPSGLEIDGVNALAAASPREISFIAKTQAVADWETSEACAAVVTRGIDVPSGSGELARAIIYVADARLALVDLLELFEPDSPDPVEGVHALAVVHPDARIAQGASVGPYVTIRRGARIEEDCVIGPGCDIGAEVKIGSGSVLSANVVIGDRCTLGRRCRLHAGVVIGADGFGFVPVPGAQAVRKVPHIGSVKIEDNVEIGANSCIDRGKFGATHIGEGSKIDNLVHIAHNCRIGRNVLIAGMSGIAGSVTIGDGVIVGGAVGISDHLSVGEGAKLMGRCVVTRDVPAGETYFGNPAQPWREAFRQHALIRRQREINDSIERRLRALERRDVT